MDTEFQIDKRQARRTFGRAADSYDAAAVLQHEVGRRMLERLSGRWHEVMTRFALMPRQRQRAALTVTTRVRFRALSPAEIDAYVATGEGRDKAGAYGIQGIGAALVEAVDGSEDAVLVEIQRLTRGDTHREPRLQARAARADTELLRPIPDSILRFGYGRRAAGRGSW